MKHVKHMSFSYIFTYNELIQHLVLLFASFTTFNMKYIVCIKKLGKDSIHYVLLQSPYWTVRHWFVTVGKGNTKCNGLP